MSGLIKLFCSTEINEEINCLNHFGELKIDKLKTSDLNAAVDHIFNEFCWKKDIFENAKKDAIKSILRDRVHACKAETLGIVLAYADRELIKYPEPTPEQMEQISRGIQNHLPAFDLYEIGYILKNREKVREELSKAQSTCCFYDFTVSDDKIISIFDKIHSRAKKELFSKKPHFRNLNKQLSRRFGFTEEEINLKVYREIHRRLPGIEILATPENIQKFCDSINPTFRKEIYETLFGNGQTLTALAEIVGIIESLNENEIASIDDLLANGIKKEFFEDPQALLKVRETIYSTVEEDQDRVLKLLEALRKDYFLASGQALNCLSKLISSMKTLKETKSLDVGDLKKIEEKIVSKLKGHQMFRGLFELNYKTQSINSKIDALEKKRYDLIRDFARGFIHTNPNEFDELTSKECLARMHKKYHFDFVTLIHLAPDNPNISSLMELLSDQNVQRISNFLNSAEPELMKLSESTSINDHLQSMEQFSKLSMIEQYCLNALFSVIEHRSVNGILSHYSALNNENKKPNFEEILPKRTSSAEGLDLKIIKQMYNILYERIMYLKTIHPHAIQ